MKIITRKAFLIILFSLASMMVFLIGCVEKSTPTIDATSPPQVSKTMVTQKPQISPDPITNMVVKSDLIVLGTITDKKYEIVSVGQGESAGKFTYTIFTLSVEKVIKGDPATQQALIKVEGGGEGSPGPSPSGPYFHVNDKILICLIKEAGEVYTRFPGLTLGALWVESTVAPTPVLTRHGIRMDFEKWIGELIVIMKANNIPISLPPSEWPPQPVTIPVSPPRQ